LLENYTNGDIIVPNALVATDDSGNIVGNFVGNVTGTSAYVQNISDHHLSELMDASGSRHFTDEHKDLLENYTNGDIIVPNALVATDDSGNIVGNFVGDVTGTSAYVQNISDHHLSELMDASGSRHFTDEHKDLLENYTNGDVIVPNALVATDDSGNIVGNFTGLLSGLVQTEKIYEKMVEPTMTLDDTGSNGTCIFDYATSMGNTLYCDATYGTMSFNITGLSSVIPTYGHGIVTISAIINVETYKKCFSSLQLNGISCSFVSECLYGGDLNNAISSSSKCIIQTFKFVFSGSTTPIMVISSISSYQ
jgi:hypothetical protein